MSVQSSKAFLLPIEIGTVTYEDTELADGYIVWHAYLDAPVWIVV